MDKQADAHFHRCKACNERLEHACVDPSCSKGWRWVILCLHCYESMVDEIDDMEMGAEMAGFR